MTLVSNCLLMFCLVFSDYFVTSERICDMTNDCLTPEQFNLRLNSSKV